MEQECVNEVLSIGCGCTPVLEYLLRKLDVYSVIYDVSVLIRCLKGGCSAWMSGAVVPQLRRGFIDGVWLIVICCINLKRVWLQSDSGCGSVSNEENLFGTWCVRLPSAWWVSIASYVCPLPMRVCGGRKYEVCTCTMYSYQSRCDEILVFTKKLTLCCKLKTGACVVFFFSTWRLVIIRYTHTMIYCLVHNMCVELISFFTST